MPRLLPRLLQSLKKHNRYRVAPVIPAERHPRHKPIPESRNPPQCPPLSPKGRTQSIVLDSLDPILSLSRYRRHKAANPRRRGASKRQQRATRDPEARSQLFRGMSEEERGFWASPYLRMLSTPLRQCIVSKRYLPREFLVRFAPVRLPTSLPGKAAQVLVPDGLEHPSVKARKIGQGHYAMCWKEAIEHISERGLYKRLSSNVIMHSWIGRHIAHLLRIRVLEELDVLAYNLCHIPKGGQEAPLLRRLTRAEWKQVKSSGVLPYKNAVALLVVPPLNKNPVMKLRPKPSTSATPPPVEEQPANIVRPGPPISILLPSSDEPIEEDDSRDVPMFLSRSKVPLYNGISLFPSRSHRAALHAGLLRVLDYERQARFQEHAIDVARAWATKSAEEVGKLKSKVPRAYGDQKASHAFLLCSDANTLMRADAVPLAIALWRIRIWEGAGWEGSDATANGWILD